jgi:uncharacterized protein (TIGR02466 family)
MTLTTLFATQIYTAALQGTGANEFNRRMLREIEQIRHDDAAGRKWSAKNYPGGYTSYGSLCRLHRLSPSFELLERKLRRHVRTYAKALDFELGERKLEMTDCWVNVMGRHAVHGLHLHPHSTLSGTYYVQAPRGCAGLKLEDPRLERFMAAPPRRAASRAENRTWQTIPARPGTLVLFESWLRHEVASNPVAGERVSVSFNYSWF